MDPLTVAVTTILGKYAIDKGATLLKEAGKAAADLAGKLFQKVIDHLKADPAEAKNADRYEQDPTKHQELIGEVIDEKVKADPAFAGEMKTLVEAFERASGTSIMSIASSHAQIFSGDNAFVVGTNTGTILQNKGDITIGNINNTVNTRSGGTDVNANEVDINGDVAGRDKKSNE